MFPTEIQLAIRKRLADTPYFATTPAIPVIARCQMDIVEAVNKAVGSIGICVLVLPGKGKFERHETPIPCIRGEYVIKVIENIVINRTRGSGTMQPAEKVAWACAQRLWHFSPMHAETNTPLAGGHFILGELETDIVKADGQEHLETWFSATITGGDSEGLYGVALVRD